MIRIDEVDDSKIDPVTFEKMHWGADGKYYISKKESAFDIIGLVENEPFQDTLIHRGDVYIKYADAQIAFKDYKDNAEIKIAPCTLTPKGLGLTHLSEEDTQYILSKTMPECDSKITQLQYQEITLSEFDSIVREYYRTDCTGNMVAQEFCHFLHEKGYKIMREKC